MATTPKSATGKRISKAEWGSDVIVEAVSIAKALDRAPGAIVVIGHADAAPTQSRTNEEISLDRARAVAGLIARTVADPSRVRVEGRGDAEPVAPNDSETNRARNRRVVIEVRK